MGRSVTAFLNVITTSCTTSADCQVGYVCQNGECVQSGQPPPPDWTQIAVLGGILGVVALAIYAMS